MKRRVAMQLLACIGEQFTEGDEICGIVVNVRAKQDKLCVWTKTASNEAAQVIPFPLRSLYFLYTRSADADFFGCILHACMALLPERFEHGRSGEPKTIWWSAGQHWQAA
jgi:hypothetical protein